MIINGCSTVFTHTAVPPPHHGVLLITNTMDPDPEDQTDQLRRHMERHLDFRDHGRETEVAGQREADPAEEDEPQLVDERCK